MKFYHLKSLKGKSSSTCKVNGLNKIKIDLHKMLDEERHAYGCILCDIFF
jgi:hypothetical protein